MMDQVLASAMLVASWLLFASLKSLAVIALVLLVRRLCARWLAPQWRYGLWFAVLACLSVPAGMQVQIRSAPAAAVLEPGPAASAGNTVVFEQPTITIDDAPAATAPRLSTASMATLIWLLGVAGLASLVLGSVFRYRRICSQAADVDAPTNELFQRCKQMLNVRLHVRLLETSRVASPLVVGYWRPTLLLPRDLSAQVSSEQLRLVLLHELTHVKRHDILVNWLISAVQIAHWFNPLAWHALRLMRHDMEQACDASVLRHLSSREQIEYGDTLIRLSDLAPRRTLLVQNASVIDSRSQLQSRIRMIAQFQARRPTSSVLGAALIAVLGVAAVTQAADAPSPVSQAAPAAAAAKPVSVLPPVAEPEQPKLVAAETKATAQPDATGEARKSEEPAKLETAVLHINYAKAQDLVDFIKSAPRLGLASGKGNLGFDERENIVLVQDTPSNVSAIRAVIKYLDAPLEQALIEAYIAFVDRDLLQELTSSATTDGKWSPVTILQPVALGPDQSIWPVLDAAQQAHRAEVIAAPRIIVADRKRASLEIPATGANDKRLGVKLAFQLVVTPEKRLKLDVNTTLDRFMTVPNPGVVTSAADAMVPAMDSRQFDATLFMDSGATALLDLSDGPDNAGNAADPQQGRRLVLFATPRLLPSEQPKSR